LTSHIHQEIMALCEIPYILRELPCFSTDFGRVMQLVQIQN